MAGPKVLYIVYWGASEPLGQSLVLPAVNRLAALGVDLTLITFEKPADSRQTEQIARLREAFRVRGVNWIPLIYHKRPKIPATLFDIVHGCARAILSRVGNRFDVVHARTFIGGLIGLLVAPVLQSKLVYHNEGFYPDEQVDAGLWSRDSLPHRLAKALERRLYAHSDAIIALSNRAKQQIEALPAVVEQRTPVIVVPSCVDLDRFSADPPKKGHTDGCLRFVYAGSVGGRYRLDQIARFVQVASKDHPVHLQVLSHTSPDLVRSVLNSSGLRDGEWSVANVPHSSIPAELSKQTVGMHFLAQGLSDYGGSPTKIGEYWAMGLPVVLTSNISDCEDIVYRERVGVILNGCDDYAYSRALAELRVLLADDDLADRCRQAAESHYGLEAACEEQASLYHRLSDQKRTNEGSSQETTTENNQVI
jgi:glycosyltransferase involved in cell wall biosynthesis